MHRARECGVALGHIGVCEDAGDVGMVERAAVALAAAVVLQLHQTLDERVGQALPQGEAHRHVHPSDVEEEETRMGIAVNVQHLAGIGVEITAAGGVDDARGVVILGPPGDLLGPELPPGLIERHPHCHRGVVIELIDDLFPFFAELRFRFGCALRLRAVEITVVLPFGRGASVGHVLPDEDAQPVAVPVPAFGFDLHVLADHVEP